MAIDAAGTLKTKVGGQPMYVWGVGALVLILGVAYYRNRKAKAAAAANPVVATTDTSAKVTGTPGVYDANGNYIGGNGSGLTDGSGFPLTQKGPQGYPGVPGPAGKTGPAGPAAPPVKPPTVKPPTTIQTALQRFQAAVLGYNKAQTNYNMLNTALAHEKAANVRKGNTYTAEQTTALNHQVIAARQTAMTAYTDVAHKRALLPPAVQPVATVRSSHDMPATASKSLQTK